MKILVTGGAGYIGSHTCVELLNAGYEIIVVDNFLNSKEESLKRVQEITGKKFDVYNVDLLDEKALDAVFSQFQVDAVVHFAGLKAVGESVAIPLRYYHNNITGTLSSGTGVDIYNLGTGRGYSVLEMVEAFKRASQRAIPYEIVGRRPGDIASCYADPSKAKSVLGWSAERGLDQMCADSWRWQSNNPDGYQ